MLREHAFDSDSLFTQTLETDQRELLAEVVRDYWRSFHGCARPPRRWPRYGNGGRVPEASAGQCLSESRRSMPHLLADELSPRSPAEALARTRLGAKRQRRLAELKAPWAGMGGSAAGVAR
jgi:exodeoxyribonuclease V beta subunit